MIFSKILFASNFQFCFFKKIIVLVHLVHDRDLIEQIRKHMIICFCHENEIFRRALDLKNIRVEGLFFFFNIFFHRLIFCKYLYKNFKNFKKKINNTSILVIGCKILLFHCNSLSKYERPTEILTFLLSFPNSRQRYSFPSSIFSSDLQITSKAGYFDEFKKTL